jgi:hypothetical protein
VGEAELGDGVGDAAGSSWSMGSGLPLGTAQKPQRRVQRLPSIMKVAVFWFQHSPMLGQWADSQTVCRLRSRASFLRLWKVSPMGAGATRLEPSRAWGGLARGEVDLDQRVGLA